VTQSELILTHFDVSTNNSDFYWAIFNTDYKTAISFSNISSSFRAYSERVQYNSSAVRLPFNYNSEWTSSAYQMLFKHSEAAP